MSKLIHNLIHFSEAHIFASTSIAVFLFGGCLTYLTGDTNRQPGGRLPHLANHFFPVAGWFTPTSLVDLLFYLTTKLTQVYKVLLSGFVGAAAALAIRHALVFCVHGPTQPAHLPALILAIAAMTIFGDLGAFAYHMLEHRVRPLWEFHKVHHSATFLTPLTAYRTHPVSDLMNGASMGLFEAVPLSICISLWHFSLDDKLLLATLPNLILGIGPLGVLQHTHFAISFGRLERIFVSPVMHHIHHSIQPEHYNKNYGTRLSIWDWCIGTAATLPKGQRLQFGLDSTEDPRGDFLKIPWCYVGPFIACGKMLAGKFQEITSFCEQKEAKKL